MGAGNTLIRDEFNNAVNTYYIEYYEHSEEINEDTNEPYCNNNPCYCNDCFYDDVISNLSYIKDLTILNKIENNSTIIGTNNVLKLLIADNEWSCAIACVPIYNNNNNYNNYIFKLSANRIIKAIAEIYNLKVRTSAWTSGDTSHIKNNEYY